MMVLRCLRSRPQYMPILTDALTPQLRRQWELTEKRRINKQHMDKPDWKRDSRELHANHPPGLQCKECNEIRDARTELYDTPLPKLRAKLSRSTSGSYMSLPYALPELGLDISRAQV